MRHSNSELTKLRTLAVVANRKGALIGDKVEFSEAITPELVLKMLDQLEYYDELLVQLDCIREYGIFKQLQEER